jgi:superfamily II DNA or RNA helicase
MIRRIALMKFSFNQIDTMSPTDFEEFVMDCFGNAGWKNLHRTEVGIDSRYGDGGYDIEGWREDRKWLIEVKQRSKSTVGIDSLRQIQAAGSKYKVKNLILVTNQTFSSVVIDEAAKLGVELFDREKLRTLYVQGSTDIGKRIKLRTYQQEILDTFEKKYLTEGKCKFLLEMATGLGKTVTSAALVERMLELTNKDDPKVLFVVHQKEIVKQSREAYKSYFGFTKYQYAVLYDGEEIQDHDFIFATFQTILLQKRRLPKNYFDIIIVDEAHHFAAVTFSNLSTLFEPTFLIGLSATPERVDGKDVYRYFGGKECVLGKLDLAWALKNKHLAQPKYHILTDDIDADKLSSIKNGLTKSELDKTLFLHKKDDEIIKIIDDQLREVGVTDPRCIVFCRNIRHINNFLNYLPPGTATVIHSKMSRENQRRAISDFREGSYRYILTVDIFNEGVDIPEVNALVFLRSTASKTIWLQQLGRGLRKTPEKNFVEVFDFVGSVGRILDVEELKKNIHKTVRSSKSAGDTEEEFRGDEEEEVQVLHDTDLNVSYSKYAAEVQKLLEQYQFKINTRQDCTEEILRIAQDLDRIPLQQEIVEGLQSVSIDQFVTIFNDYWTSISSVLGERDTVKIKEMIEARIVETCNYHKANYRVTPSAEMIQLETSFSGLPLSSIPYIKSVIKEIPLYNESSSEFPKKVFTQLKPTKSVQISSSKNQLFDNFKGQIFSKDDLKNLTQEDRNIIRLEFPLDFDFIAFLEERRSMQKKAG